MYVFVKRYTMYGLSYVTSVKLRETNLNKLTGHIQELNGFNVDILLTKRRLYRKAKRRARYKFNLDQKRKLNNLA